MTRTKKDSIKAKLVFQLKKDRKIDARKIEIDATDDGEVTLNGYVQTYYNLKAAEKHAWRIPGVTCVINNLIITGSEFQMQPSDDLIESYVKSIIKNNTNINHYKINAKVSLGVVFLRGTVDEYWKTVHLEEIVAKIHGVLDVVNELVVVPNDSTLDEILAMDVVNALERAKLSDIDLIDIKVEDGIVTLFGVLKDGDEYLRVADITIGIPGVRHVQNNMVLGCAA